MLSFGIFASKLRNHDCLNLGQRCSGKIYHLIGAIGLKENEIFVPNASIIIENLVIVAKLRRNVGIRNDQCGCWVGGSTILSNSAKVKSVAIPLLRLMW